MRIKELADRVGATTQAVRFYESRGFLPAPARTASGYRNYAAGDEEQLRLLLGLRQLGLPLERAGEIAGLCASGHCAQVSEGRSASIDHP